MYSLYNLYTCLILTFFSFIECGELIKRNGFYEIIKENKVIGYAFYTDELVPEIEGYGGKIKLLIKTDINYKITNIELISHNETPEYVGDLDKWLKQFIGKSSKDKFILGEDVSPITGATITSSAISNMISIGVKKLSGVIHKKRKLPFLKEKLTFIVIILAIISYFIAKGYIRYLYIPLAVIYFGFIRKLVLSISDIVKLLSAPLPDFYDNFAWYIILLGSLLCAIILGACYCGWLCPFGLISEFIGKITPKRWRISLPEWVHVKLRFLQCITLLFVIFFSFEKFFPDVTLVHRKDIIGYFTLLVFLLFSIAIPRFWCRYFCPKKAIFGYIGKFAIFRKKISIEKCNLCKICLSSCPMGAIFFSERKKIYILNELCIQCNTCKSLCKNKCIR